MKFLKISIFALAFILLRIPAFADTLYLRDGRVYTGQFMKGDREGVQFKSGDKIFGFPVDSVSFFSVGEKPLDVREANEKGQGVLKGVVTCRQNIDSRLGPDPKPDWGARIYAYKLKVDNRLILYKYDDFIRSDKIDDFIKDYLMYRWAKRNRNLLSRHDLKPENHEDLFTEKRAQLKKLGADTEEGWEGVKNRGRKVFAKLDRGEIPSWIALAARDGGFSFLLPAGYYFLLVQSPENRLEDTYAAVKISNGKTTEVSMEIIFLN